MFYGFLLLHLFYIALYLTFRSNRKALIQSLQSCTLWLLTQPPILKLISLLEMYKNRFPTVKKERNILHIVYTEKGQCYHIHIPCQRMTPSKTYELINDKKTERVTYPPGVQLLCSATDLRCTSIEEV